MCGQNVTVLCNLSQSHLSGLQNIQNSLTRAVVRAAKPLIILMHIYVITQNINLK